MKYNSLQNKSMWSNMHLVHKKYLWRMNNLPEIFESLVSLSISTGLLHFSPPCLLCNWKIWVTIDTHGPFTGNIKVNHVACQHTFVIMLHVDINKMHDINKIHVNIIMLDIDIIDLAYVSILMLTIWLTYTYMYMYMSTCIMIMSTCYRIMSTCEIIMLLCNLNYVACCHVNKLYVNNFLL